MKSFLFNLALVVVIAGWCSGQTLTFKESFPNYQHDGTVAFDSVPGARIAPTANSAVVTVVARACAQDDTYISFAKSQ